MLKFAGSMSMKEMLSVYLTLAIQYAISIDKITSLPAFKDAKHLKLPDASALLLYIYQWKIQYHNYEYI